MTLKLKFPSVSKAVKQHMVGGALAGTVVGVESGMSWFVAEYPQILKDQINPMVPRNGALLADLAPAGAAFMIKKRGRSTERMKHTANGMLLYDLPKLLDEFAYNIAYTAGLPQAGLPLRLGNSRAAPMRLNIRPAMNNGVVSMGYQKMGSGAGKYQMKTTNSVKAAAGIGRYR